jgi:ParB family chromosome partitioning protein
MAKPVLGRGLGALLKSQETATPPQQQSVETTEAFPVFDEKDKVLRVPLSSVVPSLMQPRKDFIDDALDDLANSIREQGILQPLIVRKQGEKYELIAGERRWRASQKAGLQEVPVIVRDGSDQNVLELMLIENLQREDLNAIEEARGYSELAEKFDLTQEDIAVKVGRSRTSVANALRLLNLAPEVQQFLREGRISVGHAKVILGLATHSEQNLATERIVRNGLSVRQTEELVSQWGQSPTKRRARRSTRAMNHDSNVAALENQLREKLGTKVALKYKDGKGSLEVKFYDDDDLNRILDILGINL